MRVDSTTSEPTEVVLRRISDYRRAPHDRRVIVEAVAVAEGAVDEIISSLFADHPTMADATSRFLLDEQRSKFTQTWSARIRVLRGAFGIDIDSRVRERFDTTVDVRNAFVHGDGSLSPMQSKSWSSMLQLKTSMKQVLDVHVSGTRLNLGPRTVELALGAIEDFLLALDTAAQAVLLSWRIVPD